MDQNIDPNNIPASHQAYIPGADDAAEAPEQQQLPEAETIPEPEAQAVPEPAPEPAKPTAKAPAAATPLSKWAETMALTLSTVFSPLLVPTYACAIALWITPLAAASERARFVVSAFIFLLTAALPMALIMFMIRNGKVGNSAITERSERTWPFIFTGVCYLATTLLMYVKHAPHWLVFFYGGATFALILAVAINTRWKISAHSMCMGGLCALVFFIAFQRLGLVAMLPWVIGTVLLTGAVGASRLLLGRHTPGQVYAGAALGFIIEYLFMSI